MHIPEELLYAAALAAIGWLLVHLGARRRRAAYIDGFDLAALLDARLAKRRPELDGGQRRQVLEGLREWFHVCREAGRRRVSMPSQAVDDAWHEFILFTRNYRDFCRRGLGRFLHHVPAEAPRLSASRSTEGSLPPGATGRRAKVFRVRGPAGVQDGIRRTWRIACRRCGIDPRKPTRLPPLFALDSELDLPDGFRYRLDCRREDGRREGDGGGSTVYCAAHMGCGSGCGTGGSDSGAGGDGGSGSDGGSGCSGCGGGD